MQSQAQTVVGYLNELPADRRKEISVVRRVISGNLPAGYRETMGSGMIAWVTPLSRFGDTYNGRPFFFAGLASQTTYCAVHLMSIYGCAEHERRLRASFAAMGRKPNMGKSCIRFQRADQLPLDTIGQLIAEMPPERWIDICERERARRHQHLFATPFPLAHLPTRIP